MFGRLYHPNILRGACQKSCKCSCRCLTSDSDRLCFLYLHQILRKNMTESITSSESSGRALPPNMPQPNQERQRCIFCRIVDGTEPTSKDKILFQDDEFVVFPDIRPASKHHLLVVSREHIKDAKFLTSSQVPFLDRMVVAGKKALGDRLDSEQTSANASQNSKISTEEAVSKALLGFHWPPFHTVSHLHLHVIAPTQEMGFIGRIIFRPNSYWFVQPEWVKDRLSKQVSP